VSASAQKIIEIEINLLQAGMPKPSTDIIFLDMGVTMMHLTSQDPIILLVKYTFSTVTIIYKIKQLTLSITQ
jgi:hypothetical protein